MWTLVFSIKNPLYDRIKAKFSDFFLRSNCLSSRIFLKIIMMVIESIFIALYLFAIYLLLALTFKDYLIRVKVPSFGMITLNTYI